MWLTDADGQRRIAALAWVFDLLGLPRYPALWRSGTTAGVLDAYERTDTEGKKAFPPGRRRFPSGIRQPASPSSSGAHGDVESAALLSAAELLEPAVAGAELVPESRGWKERQQEMVRAHLTTARIKLGGGTLLDTVGDELLQTWLEARRSPARRRLFGPLLDLVRSPLELPGGLDDPNPPLRWPLGELADGEPLPQTGNFGPALVQDAAGRFGWWDFRSPPRSGSRSYP